MESAHACKRGSVARWKTWHETRTPMWLLIGPIIFSHGKKTLGPFIRGKIRRKLYHLCEHVSSDKTRLS